MGRKRKAAADDLDSRVQHLPAARRPHGNTTNTNKRICLRTEPPPGPAPAPAPAPQPARPPSSIASPPYIAVQHPVLALYFRKVFTLRVHLTRVLRSVNYGAKALRKISEIDPAAHPELHWLLDTALVGHAEKTSNSRSLAEKVADATASVSDTRTPVTSQSEMVDLALQTLFLRSQVAPKTYNAIYPGRPNNVLTLGYTTNNKAWKTGRGANVGPMGVDVVNVYPNTHVNALKKSPWTVIGRIVGEEAMLDLLVNTSVFIRCAGGEEGKGNYYQLTGPPISDVKNTPISANHARGSPTSLGSIQAAGSSPRPTRSEKSMRVETAPAVKAQNLKMPGDIKFVRSRMFYSKPAYNSRCHIMFGLRHLHVLNRFPKPDEKAHALHILKYMFPRQFGLHNAFTSVVDRNETVQPFKDYVFREEEIIQLKNSRNGRELSTPNRLRGEAVGLVSGLQKLHTRCSYHALINYYCPVPTRGKICNAEILSRTAIPMGAAAHSSNSHSSAMATQAGPLPAVMPSSTSTLTPKDNPAASVSRTSFTDFASTSSEVSAFARAVILKVIPRAFFGTESDNRWIFLHNVDRFVGLRRYETLTLHTVMQGIKLAEIDWLRPPSVAKNSKMSKSDEAKRRELLAEFIYWLFDSFLVPLLRANFYVTESNFHRNHVFYFRHDVWKKLTEPALSSLKMNMLQELPERQAKELLSSRQLGYSHIRLLPKEYGIRPIMNLKKRDMEKRNGRRVLTPSINMIMAPVFNVLSLEKLRHPEKIGSSMANINNIYTRLKGFQAKLAANRWSERPLYFAKVDVTGCFDAIPQDRLLKLVDAIIQDQDYWMVKYSEVRAPWASVPTPRNGVRKPIKRWLTRARPTDQIESFAEFSQRVLKAGQNATIFVDDVVYKSKEKSALLELLNQHVHNNMVKIGRKYFRQKTGIPQGSVLSTILCNFFYADMEREKLSFTGDEDGMLLRLVDDFLFITLNQDNATRFLQVMHDGNPEYGASVNPEKSMVNFETTINGKKIHRPVGSVEFPYCGNLVNTKTLNIRKDRDRKLTAINDMLSVEYSRKPGSTLLRKAVNAWKVHATGMYFDTSLNSFDTVIQNIFHNFVEVAMKFHRYVKSLSWGSQKRPTQQQLASTVSHILEVAFEIMDNRQKNSGGQFQCSVTHGQVRWLGAQAFKLVLQRKQSGYRQLLEHLSAVQGRERRALQEKSRIDPQILDTKSFAENYRY